MPANHRHPVLGFDRKKDAVVHLHSRGLGVDAIFAETGSTPGSVRTTLLKHRLKPRPQSTHSKGGPPIIFIELSLDMNRLLRPHASKRGLSCSALAALIVETVVCENLVDATLDDGATP